MLRSTFLHADAELGITQLHCFVSYRPSRLHTYPQRRGAAAENKSSENEGKDKSLRIYSESACVPGCPFRGKDPGRQIRQYEYVSRPGYILGKN